jgi:NADH-quinone oxidoreductase subunit D
MPDDWRGYPLRKDYGLQNMDNQWVKKTLESRAANDYFRDHLLGCRRTGPEHGATAPVNPRRASRCLKLDGENVKGTDSIIGYLHRGVEKIAENRTYAQFAPYVDRMDYVAAISNNLGYCLAVEKLINAEAPPRAQRYG